MYPGTGTGEISLGYTLSLAISMDLAVHSVQVIKENGNIPSNISTKKSNLDLDFKS